MQSLRWLLLLALLVLFATGCGSSAWREGEPSSSPLAALLGDEFGLVQDAEDQLQRFKARQLDQEVLIAECMQAAGFEYVPKPLPIERTARLDDFAWGSREWVSTYGFGVSTQYLPQEQLEAWLVGSATTVSAPPDPNQEYLSDLDPGEFGSYMVTLEGSDGSLGCAQQAFEAMDQNDPLLVFSSAFSEDLTALLERARSDPRVLEHERNLLECVRRAGFEFDGINRAHEEVYGKLGFLEEESSYEGTTTSSGLPRLTREASERLGDVQDSEVALALAVHQCGGGPAERQELSDTILLELEAEFVSSNRDDLESFKDSRGP